LFVTNGKYYGRIRLVDSDDTADAKDVLPEESRPLTRQYPYPSRHVSLIISLSSCDAPDADKVHSNIDGKGGLELARE
jgi:hypothetical protein